jgi:hypothetical protein
MIDIAKAIELLESYFVNVTNEQFAIDLKEFCPELFEADINSSLDTEPSSNEDLAAKK